MKAETSPNVSMNNTKQVILLSYLVPVTNSIPAYADIGNFATKKLRVIDSTILTTFFFAFRFSDIVALQV